MHRRLVKLSPFWLALFGFSSMLLGMAASVPWAFAIAQHVVVVR